MKKGQNYTLWLSLVIAVFTLGCESIAPENDTVLLTNDKQQATLSQLNDRRFSRFVVHSREDFKNFDKVILFKMHLEDLVVTSTNDSKINRSWRQAKAEDVFEIADQFDLLAPTVFNKDELFEHTNVGADDVLAIQFRLKKFVPAVSLNGAWDDKTEQISRFNSFGTASVQVVLAHAQTNELIAVIEDTVKLNPSSVFSRNTKQNQIIAWRKTFKTWLTRLKQDLIELREVQES